MNHKFNTQTSNPGASTLNTKAFYDLLLHNDLDFFTGVPDSLLSDFCSYVHDHAPAARKLFPEDISGQASKLAEMLDTAVSLLSNDPPALVQALTDLAERHHNYGVVPAHYELVGTALVGALQMAFDKEFTAEVKLAWIHLYSQIVLVMLPVTVRMCNQGGASSSARGKEE